MRGVGAVADIDVDGFLLPHFLYFIAPYPRPKNPNDLPPRLARVEWPGPDGAAEGVVTFTDLDLAERFIERQELVIAAGLKPITVPDPAALEDLVRHLALIGATHLLVDPEPIHVARPLPLARVLAAVRRSRRPD